MVENDDPFAVPADNAEQSAPESAVVATTPVASAETPTPTIEPEIPVEPRQLILYGSSVLPATFEIGRETVQLGTIVSAAFEASGMAEDAWNDLVDADRDVLLSAELAKRGYVAPAQEAEMVENDDADVFGGLVPMTHPDGGACDLFEEIDGKLLVPSDMVETMTAHGFQVDA